MFNKEIYKIKLALTTNCNLDCQYCFVKKTGERMPWEIARKSVDLLIDSPGKEKLLSMYGGEPFLEVPLIEQIVEYARLGAAKKNKKLTISIATNLTILNKKIISLIKENNIKITISIVGISRWHNKFRRFASGKGTHNIVLKNLKILSSRIPEKNLGISFVVFPSTSGEILKNFNAIRKLTKIKNINFEIVQEFEKWKEEDRANFADNYRQIILNLAENILKGSGAYYVNAINWETAKGLLSEKYSGCCPFKYSLEIYPSGEMAFSPFLLNRKNKEEFVVGGIENGIKKEYLNCVFDKNKSACAACERKYYEDYKDFCGARKVKSDYDLMSLKTSRYIKKQAKINKKFKRYINDVKKYRCF